MSTLVDLPDSEALAGLVSGVTETMFNITCNMAEGGEAPVLDESSWPLVLLHLSGHRELTVAVATDPDSSRLLASAMFDSPLAEVDEEMAMDSLRELVNIIAGQIKALLGGDCNLGLPLVGNYATAGLGDAWRGVFLANSDAGVTVWVAMTPGHV